MRRAQRRSSPPESAGAPDPALPPEEGKGTQSEQRGQEGEGVSGEDGLGSAGAERRGRVHANAMRSDAKRKHGCGTAEGQVKLIIASSGEVRKKGE